MMIARSIKSRFGWLIAALVAMLAAAGCGPPPGTHYRLDTLSPRSDLTQKFYDIFVLITAIDIVI
ncbi:MAG: hypothetical protein ACRETD_14990, partial [Steroidobacteraceae bacterium]